MKLTSHRRIGCRALLVVAAAIAAMPAFSVNGIAAPSSKSTALISGEFGDSCRDFVAGSSKDISNVVIHFADGRVIKDESTATPRYSIDGGPGDEIGAIDVKSGTTTETFTCQATGSPPTAVLEILTREECVLVFEDPESWHCGSASAPRTVWRDLGGGVGFSCISFETCASDFSFRGINSTDPDGDIMSWSIEFDHAADGSVDGSASGAWVTDPPTEVVLTLPPQIGFASVTLTVTDSAGQSASDTMVVSLGFLD